MGARGLALLLLVACQARHAKPVAAVDVKLDARPLGDGRYELTLRAIPTADVDAIDLHLFDRRSHRGPTAAGTVLTLTTSLRASGKDLAAGSAAVWIGNHRRSRAASVRLAPPAPAPAYGVVVLPDGSRVAVVR